MFLACCLVSQIISWRLWFSWIKSRSWRSVISFFFVAFNLGWFFSIGTLYMGESLTDFTWSWVGRPSVSWQLLHALAILPFAAALSICGRLWRLLRRGSAEKKKDSPKSEVSDQSRRGFLRTVAMGGSMFALGAAGYGVWRQAQAPGIDRQTILIPNLPAKLDGFTIAHVTDIHLGLWASQKELDKALAVVAAEKPHLVALTGDLVDRDAEYAKLYHEPLKRLKDVPFGVWGVLGNHDHYTRRPEVVAGILNGSGLVTILVDQQVNIAGLPLSLIGLDDPGMHHSWTGNGGPNLNNSHEDPDVLNFQIVRGPAFRRGDFVILLNHRPEGFAQAIRHGCGLYLAGHTHGGQYAAPWDGQLNLAAAFYKYSRGLYQQSGGWLNVSPGLAAVGVPFRFGAWPEVSLITLRKS